MALTVMTIVLIVLIQAQSLLERLNAISLSMYYLRSDTGFVDTAAFH